MFFSINKHMESINIVKKFFSLLFGKIKNKIKKKIKIGFFALIFINILTAAAVGALFGYYGAGWVVSGDDALNNSADFFYRRAKQQSKIMISDEEEAIVGAVKRSAPAVVSIVATQDLIVFQQRRGGLFQDLCDDPFFRQFFALEECDSAQADPLPKTQRREVSAGTGFFVSAKGLIVTNKHVVNIAKADFTVLTSDGGKYPAKILAKDPFNDLALLKIDSPVEKDFPILFLGNSDALQVGQSVIAIGNALGEFSNTVSRGVVSGLARSIVARSGTSSERLEKLIQTDAAINPGNSGGPLLNLRGEVIGVNTAIAQGAQSVGFAIPVNQIKKAINDVKTQGRIVYPYIGVRYLVITPQIKAEKNLTVDYGVIIVSEQENSGIVPDSPAEKAGLKDGDIILEVNEKKLSSENDLAKAIQNFKVGDQIALKILREGQNQILPVVLEERK